MEVITISKCVDSYYAYFTLSFDPELGDLSPVGVKAFFSHFDAKGRPVYKQETAADAARRNDVVLFLCPNCLFKSLPENKIPKTWWIKDNHIKALEWAEANEAANYMEQRYNFKELYKNDQ